MQELIIATRNKGKQKEIISILQGIPYHLIPVTDFPNIPEVEEDEVTLEGNALKKAREIYSIVHLPTIADDSGLEVYELGMQPGVYSARYAGDNVTYEDNNRKLLKELEGIPAEKRNARFRCVVAFISKDIEKTFEGVCEGKILAEPRGTNGFGYDPLFQPQGYDQTFAELSGEVKNVISHRAKAFNLARKSLF